MLLVRTMSTEVHTASTAAKAALEQAKAAAGDYTSSEGLERLIKYHRDIHIIDILLYISYSRYDI